MHDLGVGRALAELADPGRVLVVSLELGREDDVRRLDPDARLVRVGAELLRSTSLKGERCCEPRTLMVTTELGPNLAMAAGAKLRNLVGDSEAQSRASEPFLPF